MHKITVIVLDNNDGYTSVYVCVYVWMYGWMYFDHVSTLTVTLLYFNSIPVKLIYTFQRKYSIFQVESLTSTFSYS